MKNATGITNIWRKNWSLLWIPFLSIVVHNDWYLVAYHEWFIGIITDCMQFINRIELEWFLFLKTIYWMNMSWMCEDCIPWRWIDTWWMIGRKEERTLDSNPFNDVYSIFMLSVILIMRIEWKELKTDENVIGCDLESIRFL